MRLSILLTSTALFLGTSLTPVYAQNTDGAESEATPQDDDFHSDDDIIVTAPYGKRLDILAGTSAIAGTQLAAQARGQIGDTLTNFPACQQPALLLVPHALYCAGFRAGALRF